MSLNWNWNDKMGEIITKSGHTLTLYQGNALFIAIAEYEEDGKELYNLCDFASDMEHFNNMLGLNAKNGYGKDNLYKEREYKTIRLNLKYKSVPKIIEALAKARTPITIELYEENEP